MINPPPLNGAGVLVYELEGFVNLSGVKEVYISSSRMSDGSHLVASVDLGFRLSALPGEGADIPDELLDEKTGRVVIAYVRAAYMVTYAIESGDTLAATDIEEFCRVNAIHTAWPFWREFITSSLSRGGLEAVPVPMFNVYGSRPKPVTYVPENP